MIYVRVDQAKSLRSVTEPSHKKQNMETKETKSAGGVVLNPKGEVLLVYHRVSDLWGFPKGGIELEESPLEAAKREIYEESGVVELTLLKELGTYSRYRVGVGALDDQTEMKTITMFLFETEQIELGSHDPENPKAKWFPRDKVLEFLFIPKDRAFFEGIFSELPDTVATL
jgi:8-oxo-dGTP pyrophosphatase MutT (NUDIX family)